MTAISIRSLILRCLQVASPYALPLEQVTAESNLQARPPLSIDEVAGHLEWLKAVRMVDCLADPLDPENPAARKWLITEAGQASLRR